MICKHLQPVEMQILKHNVKETYRGSPGWGDDYKNWVYYDCYIDTISILKRLNLNKCVTNYEYNGMHAGAENGFFCKTCKDGIMGVHKLYSKNKIVIK